MGSDYEQSDDEEYHKALGMKREDVEDMVWKRIEKAKNKQLEDVNEIDPNIFDPINFIIRDLKVAHEKIQKNKAK